VRPLPADGGGLAVAWQDLGLVPESEELAPDALDDGRKAGVGIGRISRSTGKEGVAGKQMLTTQEADAAGGVARCVNGKELVLSKAKSLAVSNAVIGLDRHHRFVGRMTRESGAGLLANRFQCLHMVGVAMCREDVSDPQALQLLDDARRIVGGVDQQALLAFWVAQHVDVVVVGAYSEGGELVHRKSVYLEALHTMKTMAQERRIGMHMRTGRGLDKAAEMIKALELQAVQIFTGNPSAWRSASVDPKATALFKAALEELDVRPAMSHAMYLINLASPNPNFQKKSREALKAELERAQAYGLQYVVTHVGSHMGEGAQAGIDRVVAQLDQVLGTAGGSATCLLETSAGGGAYVGAKFEDLAQILSRLPQHAQRLGVCFDTAHAYASGYDVAGAEGMRTTLEQLTAIVPAERIRACHCNDTTVTLGGKADRHVNIGQGNVGIEGFKALLHFDPLAHCAFVLETPGEEMLEGLENLNTLRSLR
jgi:deoxyribonuclease-4